MTENLGSPADGSWVTEAIAEQEEYIKRVHSCLEQLGRPHRFETIRPYRLLGTGVSVPDNETWRQCLNCGVTETSEDYARKLAAGPTPPAPEDPMAVPGSWMCPHCRDIYGPEDEDRPPVCDMCKKAGRT